jgi:hypothetical protein
MASRYSARKSSRTAAVVAVAALSIAAAGCGRSSSAPPTNGGTSSSAPTSAGASATAAGDFGTLTAICGPGSARGGSARGVTDTEIHIGTTADPEAAAAPGLGQEFFDVSDGFTKWCNAAGGINGRKIVLDKLDAKLFNVAAITINACQQDFMLVGGGNAFDSAGVKPREACKLGSMPAYTVSPEASNAKLQVTAVAANATQYQRGGIRLLVDAYPAAKTGGVAVGGSNLASLIPNGKKIQESLVQLGVKVTTVQQRPPLVDNFRPYMEELKSSGTVGLDEFSGQDASPEIQAMQNIGYTPGFVLLSSQFYTPQTVQAANSISFPPTYVALQHLPFELSDQFPVLAQAKQIVLAAAPKARFTDFTAMSFDAWTEWAKSATACGSNLTVDCVLSKAAAETAWTGGGIYPPVATPASNPDTSPCILVVKLTPQGWVYDKKATQPTSGDGDYNCDPLNVAKVKTYQTS